MSTLLLRIEMRSEQDVVGMRQRARELAKALGFDTHDLTRIATAVSEIARNAVTYAGQGIAEFALDQTPPKRLRITVRDSGNGIKNVEAVLGGQTAQQGAEMGLAAAKRLMDEFEVESSPETGTVVTLGKILPKQADTSELRLGQIAKELSRPAAPDPFDEIKRQNQELILALAALQQRETELSRLNRELDETNRGVMALYAELDERAGYLKRTSDLKTSFLSNMSHEFRTPLSSILSLTRILLDRLDGELTEEQEKQVTLIRTSAESLADLVNDLLDIAKIEAGKTVIRPAPFDLADLFNALRSMFRPIVQQSRVQLIFEEPQADFPTLQSDEAKVAQVLRNLISNALKFTPEGEIRVTSRLDQGNTLQIDVLDTGIGIEPNNHSRIFDEFIQIEGSPVKSKGTGLGLPLSRKLAQLLGGDLTVQSELGVGSVFTLTLPVDFTASGDEEAATDTRALDQTAMGIRTTR